MVRNVDVTGEDRQRPIRQYRHGRYWRTTEDDWQRSAQWRCDVFPQAWQVTPSSFIGYQNIVPGGIFKRQEISSRVGAQRALRRKVQDAVRIDYNRFDFWRLCHVVLPKRAFKMELPSTKQLMIWVRRARDRRFMFLIGIARSVFADMSRRAERELSKGS